MSGTTVYSGEIKLEEIFSVVGSWFVRGAQRVVAECIRHPPEEEQE